MRWRSRPLAFRLTVKLLVGLGIILAGTAFMQVALQDHFAEDCARRNGLAVTEVLYGALHTSMLANKRDRLQRTAQVISERSHNISLRIFNKEGRIAVSSDPKELGAFLKKKTPTCARCHESPRGERAEPKVCLNPKERTHTFTRGGRRWLGIVRPIENQPSCARIGCHQSVAEEPLLGVLDVSLDLAPAEKSQRDTSQLMLTAAISAILLTVLIVLWVVRRAVQRPIRELKTQLSALGDGDYSARYEKRGDANELHQLGAALNHMAQDLERANAKLVEWNQTLERRVEDKTAELRHAQDQMVRVERMASLGKLSAVVAHEINNPLASVVTYSKLLIRRMQKAEEKTPLCEENLEILSAIASESARCGDIVTNLLLFARRTGSKQEPTDANEIIEKVLFLIKHKMDLAEVVAERDLDGDLPHFVCDPGQLEQALLALTVNAIEAMPQGGVLQVRTTREDDTIVIQIADEGIGMPPEVRDHIFEPFYTTKSEDEGKGLGLGLSVVYGIVQRNQGAIEVESTEGKGTTFTLRFPLKQPQQRDDESPDVDGPVAS